MWALQGDDGVHIIIGRGFVPVCCPAGCAAMNEDVALLAGVVDTDRFHRRATLGGPIPWQLIHMTGPQAVRAMIAIAAPGMPRDLAAALDAAKPSIFYVAPA